MFFEDKIFQLFSQSYGLKVPKWNFAHILLWKKAKNIGKTPKNTWYSAPWLKSSLLNDTVFIYFFSAIISFIWNEMNETWNILSCVMCAFNQIYMDLKSSNGEVLATWHPLFLYQQHDDTCTFFAAPSAQNVIDNN